MRGVVLQIYKNFSGMSVQDTRIWVQAGALLAKTAVFAAEHGLTGLEFASGIPGTVGAGIARNVATTDASLGQRLESARVAYLTGEIADLSKDDFVFEYRGCSLENAIVLSVKFRLEPDDAEELTKRLQKFWIVRKKTRPETEEGVARMFKNPRGQRAAELVEEAGFRGARIGGAVVFEQNSNIVTTTSGCTSDDVKRLLNLIQTQASERTGVELERELEIW